MKRYDVKRSKANQLLRANHINEHRALYLKFRGALGRQEGETPQDYSRRLSLAHSRATLQLQTIYKEEYKKFLAQGS